MNEPEMQGSKEAPESGDITFYHVSFGYQKKQVLHDVSVTLRKNTLTALVGPSGSGKSTMLKLCARFYDPQQGQVLFIRNNIRFGKTDATDEEIEAAARKACCHDFIMRLPQGYDTQVGEGGCTLSGGEKQRISIARAILKEAPVVLLDEATASLDPENEVEVQRAINTLIAGRTVIVIAHRLKTIKNADNIIVLEEGRIAEQGKHQELLDNKGLYAKLWNIQEKTLGWKL